MKTPEGQDSMFANLPIARAPAPEKPPEPAPLDGGIPSGTRRGDIAGLIEAASRVEVWCGRKHGWRPYGALIGVTDQIVVYQGVMMAGPSFDMGPYLVKIDPDDEAIAEAEAEYQVEHSEISEESEQ